MSGKFTAALVITATLLGLAFYLAMYSAPTEATMGDIQRIFYYHVPAAWTALLLFFVNFCASIHYLWKREAVSDSLALAAAEVGVVFNTAVLITGPIWARPVWGIWWTWDARLTSTLILWLIFYLAIRIWRTQHPAPVFFGGENTGIDPAMRPALYTNWLAFSALAVLLVWVRKKIADNEAKEAAL